MGVLNCVCFFGWWYSWDRSEVCERITLGISLGLTGGVLTGLF